VSATRVITVEEEPNRSKPESTGPSLGCRAFKSELMGYAAGTVGIGIVTFASLLVRLHLDVSNLNLSYIVFIVFVAALWGVRPAVFITAESVLAYNYLGLASGQKASDPEYWLGAAVLLVVALGVVYLVERIRREKERTAEAAARQLRLSAELKRVHYVASEISSQPDLALVLDHILKVLAEAVGSDKNSIFLLDQTTGVLVRGATMGLSPAFTREVSQARVCTDAACCGRTVCSKEVTIVEDTRTDPFWRPYLEQSEAAGLRAIWSVPLVGRRGKVLGTFATYHDHPSRPTAEQIEIASIYAKHAAVAIENARLYEEAFRAQANAEAVIGSSADGIMVVDASRRVTSANPALAKMSGYTAAELVGKPCHHLLAITAGEGSSYCDALCPLMSNPEETGCQANGRILETTLIRKSGQKVWVGITCGAIRDQANRPVGAVYTIRDITELKEVARLKDEFFSIASHELRTPVTSVKGYAQTILRRRARGLNDPTSEDRALRAIDKQSDRLVDLISELVEVSRISVGRLELHREPVDLASLAQQTLDQLGVTTDRHKLSLKAEGSVWADIDAGRVEQVMVNLLTNAIKYSPDGGDIVVTVSRAADRAMVQVRDHGIGIAKDRQPHLFERFYRAHSETYRDYRGIGLGLYISREIVTRHGGELWVESEEGLGSTFSFTLPLAPPQAGSDRTLPILYEVQFDRAGSG
jgi:two-component system, OmpR family, phosphate regulon sensor histidine kinase PhoR